MKRLILKEVIRKFRLSHGNRYNYNLVNYKGCDTKVIIICKVHGEFKQTPYKHYSQGCPCCGGSERITTKLFISRCKKTHGDTYNYDLVNYKNGKSKVSIICLIHGKFKQRPYDHYHKKQGCPKCFGNIKSNTKEFVNKCSKIHDNKYDYSLVDYKNNHTKVTIICPTHGKFTQTPNHHLKGIGCNKCGHIATASKRRWDSKHFIKKAIKTHGNKYNYSKVNYKNNNEKVIIICKKHGEFEQKANSHLNGRGCSKCNLSKGVILIGNFLKRKNINYLHEHKFNDCINPKTGEKLPYDIFVKSLNLLIEFDGEQHYKIRFWKERLKNLKLAKKAFKNQKYRDKKKNEYANKNNIRLLRISHLEIDNINEILEKEISLLKRKQQPTIIKNQKQ